MKTCPTCGARAFDDAEVCFGCLHRYGEEAARPATGPTPPVSAMSSVSTPGPPSASAGSRCPAMRPEVSPERAKPRVAEPPRDEAGWTVRFELPGYASVVESGGQAGGFVVRFRRDGEAGARENSRERVPRGTHARDAPDSRALAGAAGRP